MMVCGFGLGIKLLGSRLWIVAARAGDERSRGRAYPG
jgi:hypothetical protein